MSTIKNEALDSHGRKVTVYYNLPFEQYTELDGVNSSRLKHLSHSLLAYQKNPQTIGKRSANVGHMSHCLLLEPDSFNDRYVCKPEGMIANKRHAKYQAFLETVPADAQVAGDKDYLLAGDIVESIENDELCYEHLAGGITEVTIQWYCNETGMLCKARIDHLGKNGITDLKTSKDVTPQGFQYEAKRYGYWRQAAHYRAAVKAAVDAGLIDFSDDYYILAADNTGKLNCQVLYRLDCATIDSFNEARIQDLEIVDRAEELGSFPGPGNEAVNSLEYPGLAPALPEDDDEVEESQGY